ncbi:uncharacterized protein NPIL_208701 [Nephila pilipes]|uniref:Uncharacterized protein n=1 Tax=Nephila pilipes TaxID=299642 RepID=A0A8X6TE01_NEPPI|nr:uncharacterized protein NPIL_208701 [Nephila pilipes]
MEESNLSIHTFVCASKTAYAACIFLRSASSIISVTVQLLQARSRIALVKIITIPRLDLMASAIDVRLFSSVKQALKRPNISTYFWTDSFTVLTWITRREQWSIFVTNRIKLTLNYEQIVLENQKAPEVVTEYPELNTDSNKTVLVTRSGREIKPVKRLDL